MKTYNLFISHSWRYGHQYQSLRRLLQQRSYFRFRDYSVPANDPVHNPGNEWALRAAIRRQMSPCHVVVILAGVYSTYSKWINKEIALAQRGFSQAKPILAVRPWAHQRMSVPVQEAADRIVGWNTESVVRAIQKLA